MENPSDVAGSQRLVGNRGRGRQPTLKDVASRASVDASVVSRVLNQDPVLRVAPATRQRVLDAVSALGYRPNAMARGLRTARTSTIGLVLPEVTNPVYGAIVEGAQAAATAAGYVIVLGTNRDGVEAQASFARLLDEGRVDGLLIASATLDDQVLRKLSSAKAPVVIVNRRVEGFVGSAIVDDETGARLATEHLIGLGHTRIAHIAGPGLVDTTLRRRRGYETAIEQAQLVPLIVAADAWRIEAGYRAGQQLLSMGTETTGVLVANVMTAIGVMRAIRDEGLGIPADISIVAIHDLPLAAYLEPPLTTVAMPLRELGEAAINLLRAQLAGEEAEDIMISSAPELRPRASSTVPRQ